ncbi:MAG: helix-turn-helix transcriptional regulator [Actinomycetota bacterium]
MTARVQLAARRRACGYSQESLAQQLGVTTSAVSRWEQGTSTPKAIYRQPLARSLDMTPVELERLLDVDGREITGLNGTHVPSWLGHYAALEQSAAQLRTFEPLVVPALLQTDDYAYAVEQAYHLPVTDEEVRRRVEVRLARQAVLHREPTPLEFFCLMDESVLHRAIGGPVVLQAQLRRLLSVAELPNVELRLVDLHDPPFGVAFGAFQLLTSLAASSPYIACSEDLTGKHYHDSPDVVAAHHSLFEHMFARAIGVEETIDRITKRLEANPS